MINSKITDIEKKIYGLYFINSEYEDVYILSISYDKEFLINLSKEFLDKFDFVNCYIIPIVIYQIKKISFIQKIINKIILNKNIKYEIKINNKINNFNNYNVFCYSENKLIDNRYKVIQNILLINKNNNLIEIKKYIDNKNISSHAIIFDKFYTESIANNNYI